MNQILTFVLKYVRRDYLLHGGVGTLVVVVMPIVFWIAQTFGIVYGIDAAGVLLAVGKEIQDKVMKTGTAEPLDAVWTAGACAALAHLADAFGVFALLGLH